MFTLFKKINQIGLCFLAVALIVGSAGAADLTIGHRTDPSIDPHFLYLSTNIAYNYHIYGSLVEMDEKAKKIPCLATSWKAIDERTWVFKLRRGVKFHDGSDFTAEDVVFSFDRVPKVPNNPNPYTSNIKDIIGMEIVDPYTVRFKLDEPNPSLPAYLTRIAIVSKKVAEGASTADFTSGKAAIGAGPYKFVKYVPGDRLVLERNENYWGEKPVWDRVTFRIIGNDAARVAALMGGDVDMIGYVPPNEVGHLEKNPDIRVFKCPTLRVIYVGTDQKYDRWVFFSTKEGKRLDKNPFKDLRVRKAVSMAIDREAICKKVMGGLAIPASQLVPEFAFGFNPNLKVEKYDLDGAKKLLAEAGYPDGFGVTIHGPNDRYVNDSKICQAVGQMVARLGLTVKVDTMPKSIYFSRVKAPHNQFPFYLLGWGNTSGEATEGLRGVLHSYDKARGFGHHNRSNYSNPEFDRIAEQALTTIDDTEREKLYQKAMEIAIKDLAIIPLHAQFTVLATRKGLTATPRVDEMTIAMGVKPAP